MVIHSCPRCNYQTKYTTSLKEHYNRKTVCDPIFSKISIEECLDKLSGSKKYSCEYCNKKFGRHYNLKRHRDNCHEKRLKILEEKNRELEKKLEDASVNMVNSNNMINSNNTIVINNYKDTNYSAAIDDVRNSLNTELIPKFDKLIKLIFFNEKIPENHNICIPDLNRGRIMVKEDGDFKVKPREYVDNVIKDIEDFLVNHDFDKKLLNRHFYLNDEEYKDAVKEDATLELYNGRKFVDMK